MQFRAAVVRGLLLSAFAAGACSGSVDGGPGGATCGAGTVLKDGECVAAAGASGLGGAGPSSGGKSSAGNGHSGGATKGGNAGSSNGGVTEPGNGGAPEAGNGGV